MGLTGKLNKSELACRTGVELGSSSSSLANDSLYLDRNTTI
jgi:hypothetical protein